jgi:Ca2+/Na+ antiporter
LGCSALIRPLEVDTFNFLGFYAMIATAVLLYISAFIPRKGVLNRYKGVIFIALYALYIYETVIA